MRQMGQMRLPWNVYENKALNLLQPGMSVIINNLVHFGGTVQSSDPQSGGEVALVMPGVAIRDSGRRVLSWIPGCGG